MLSLPQDTVLRPLVFTHHTHSEDTVIHGSKPIYMLMTSKHISNQSLSHQLLAQISNCILDIHHLGAYKPQLLIFLLSYDSYDLLDLISGNFTLPVTQVFKKMKSCLVPFSLTPLTFKPSANTISCTFEIFLTSYHFKDLQKMKEAVEA